MEKIPDTCEGCGAISYFGTCVEYNETGACPCTKCIVKVMCSDICEKHDEWAKTLPSVIRPWDRSPPDEKSM